MPEEQAKVRLLLLLWMLTVFWSVVSRPHGSLGAESAASKVCTRVVENLAERPQQCGSATENKHATRINHGFSRLYLSALLKGIDDARGRMPEVTAAADAAAQRLTAGGELFIASVRPDFASEGIVRSGGLMLLKPYRSGARLSDKDTAILGWTNSTPEKDLALAQELKQTGAMVVGIGPIPQEENSKTLLSAVDSFLNSSFPVPSEVVERFGGEDYPVISLQNLVLLWTFTGELVGALTRRGAMPTMFQSVLVPGARERNARFRSLAFHDQHNVPPMPPGELGRAYLKELEGCFQKLLDQEVGAMEEVARRCSRVRADGHHIYAFLISHFPVHQAGAPGDPGVMQRLEGISGEIPSSVKLQQHVRQGDLFFFLGYYRRPAEAYKIVRRQGGIIVEVIVGTERPEVSEPEPDYKIRPRWPYGDSLVSVPNYDVKILPSSGIVQSAIFWSVVGSLSDRPLR